MTTVPTPRRPLRVAVLCSDRAPGLLYLLNRSPDRGVTFEIVCVVSSEETFAEEVRVERRGIPTLAPFIGDRETAAMLEPFMPDLVVLDAYRHLVTAPLLSAYSHRIISLHFDDATGDREPRATVSLVTGRPKDGRPIVRSSGVGGAPLIDAGSLLAAALRLIATRAIDLHALASTNAADPWQLDASGELVAPVGRAANLIAV